MVQASLELGVGKRIFFAGGFHEKRQNFKFNLSLKTQNSAHCFKFSH